MAARFPVRRAWAVAHAGKRIENRTWRTRYRGDLYIHASSRTVSASERAELERYGLPAQPTQSAIVAIARLDDIVPYADVCDDPWACGPYCWLLSDVRPIVPREMPGKLGLWFP